MSLLLILLFALLTQTHTLFKLLEGTPENAGEAEGTINDASTPTLKEFIAKQNISNDIDIYAKLTEMGIDWNTLLHIEPGDLEMLAKDEMHLPFKVKIKFKSAIKLMQSTYKQTTEHFFAISMKESEEVTKIQAAMNQNKGVTQLLKKHKDQVQQHAKSVNVEIDNAFEAIFKRLRSQKQSLSTKVEEWKQSKLENIEKEILDSVVSQTTFADQKKKCHDLLRSAMNHKERERKVMQTVNTLFHDNEQCRKYAETASITQYIKNNTSLIRIEFNEDVFAKMDQFSAVHADGDNGLMNMPSIHLNDPIVRDEVDDGYHVNLKWNISTSVTQKDTTFHVKYCEEDEKKSHDTEWMIADIKEMHQAQNGMQFDADVSNKYLFDKSYKYKVTLDVSEPIPLQITSNIVERMRYVLPEGPAVNIELIAHSQRKVYQSHVPDHLLQGDTSVYASTRNSDFQPNENDWIIFKLKQQNVLYLPTKCTVANSDGNPDQGVKKMKVWIGDGANQWFGFKVIDAVARSADKQQFELDRLDWNEISIKRHSLQFIKLELIENHGETSQGSCKFVLRQFELYGKTF
eukprot:548645_1